MLTERFPELSPPQTASTISRWLVTCAEEYQLGLTTLHMHFKALTYVMCSFDADEMTKYRSLKQMTRSLAYKVGNPGMFYCKQIVTWRLYLRGPVIIMGISVYRLWLASAMS